MHGSFESKKPRVIRRILYCLRLKVTSVNGVPTDWVEVSSEEYEKVFLRENQGRPADFTAGHIEGRMIHYKGQIAEWDAHLRGLYDNFLHRQKIQTLQLVA